MMEAMRRIALYGLGLLLASALALTYATSSRAKSGGPVSHTCSVTDRAFINGAKTNVDAVDLWGQQYLDGEATPADVAAESARAAKIVGATTPDRPVARPDAQAAGGDVHRVRQGDGTSAQNTETRVTTSSTLTGWRTSPTMCC
jgi:hypothetical protein